MRVWGPDPSPMVCPYCGLPTVPYGGEDVCAEGPCPRYDWADDYDQDQDEEYDDDDA